MVQRYVRNNRCTGRRTTTSMIWMMLNKTYCSSCPGGDKADRSLARSAWERAPRKNPSRRVRYDQAQLIREVFLVVMDRFLEPARYRHVVPYGTAFFGGGAVQGTSCQATVRTVPPGHLATGFRAGPAKIRNLRPRTDHGAVPSRPG
jgi:hypothetical protein